MTKCEVKKNEFFGRCSAEDGPHTYCLSAATHVVSKITLMDEDFCLYKHEYFCERHAPKDAHSLVEDSTLYYE